MELSLEDCVDLDLLSWLLAVIHIAGIGSAWWARSNEGSGKQALSQTCFLACLAVVGLTTLLACSLNLEGWYLSGTTLSVMVVAVTAEFRPRRREQVS